MSLGSNREGRTPLVVWSEFTNAFLDHYLPAEVRRARDDEFLLLRDNTMSIRRSDPSAVSAPSRFQRQRYNRPTYSGPSRSSRASAPSYRGESSQAKPLLPRCDQCGKGHSGQCRQGNCPSRGRGDRAQPTSSIAGSSSSVRSPKQGSSPAPAARGRGRGQVSASGSNQNRIYALAGRLDLESSPDVVTGILSIYSYDVYALIDPGSTLSYITPYLVDKFGIKPESLSKPFLVSSSVGEPVIARRI
ncbi:uncharacterized protein LOC132612247 [Lycium barbarum]|uniref:uncharacterized protein LOC132612247 n=1 Tax=Lycium barbarum TaxID=112863 RepID=UPI00293F1858|nr:uncharacterized protein LOC132612247 [Lycium barbarum]